MHPANILSLQDWWGCNISTCWNFVPSERAFFLFRNNSLEDFTLLLQTGCGTCSCLYGVFVYINVAVRTRTLRKHVLSNVVKKARFYLENQRGWLNLSYSDSYFSPEADTLKKKAVLLLNPDRVFGATRNNRIRKSDRKISTPTLPDIGHQNWYSRQLW